MVPPLVVTTTYTPPASLRNSRVGKVVLFYAGLTAAAVLWGAWRGHANVLFGEDTDAGPFRLAPGVLSGVSSAGIGVAGGLLLVLLTRLLHARFDWARVLHSEFHAVLGPLGDREMWALALASAIGEECLFRGALLPQLVSLLPGGAGVLLGILGSASVFALLHIGPGRHFLPWTASAFLVGMLLAGLYLLSGDLLGPIALHATVNLLNLRDIVHKRLPTESLGQLAAG